MENYLELRRELLHILTGIIIIFMIIFTKYSEFILLILLILGTILSIISIRLKVPFINKCLCLFERECNLNFPGKGLLFFVAGSLLSLQFYSQNIALASIILLTFLDPVSHFIGLNFGKIKTPLNKKKNIEGSIAGIIIGGIFASFFVGPFVSLFGSLVACLVELSEIKLKDDKIDDNLLIPLISGLAMTLLFRLLLRLS